MSTTQCDEATAALADPTADDLARRRAVTHRRTCRACEEERRVDAYLQRIAVDTGPSADDVLSSLQRHRPVVSRAMRIALGVGSMLQATIAGPWLLGANPFRALLGNASPEHLTRDGAIGFIIAVAGLVTAWRARYAFAMLGLCGAVVVMQALGGLVDDRHGNVAVSFEKVHALALLIVGLIVVVALHRERVPGPKSHLRTHDS